jgi:8-oxo-dGTP pyrophosphatase MutT (NUDIX family)
MLHKLRLCRSITVATALSGHLAPIHLSCPTFIAGFSSLQNSGRHRYHTTNLSSNDIMSTHDSSATHIDKLALILINSENKQLVARSKGKQVFYTPGGKRERGETDREALLRECMEELSVNLVSCTNTPSKIEPYGTFEAQAFGKPEGTMVRMTCYRVGPREAELELENMVKASAEIEELKWIDSGFDRELLTVTGIMILDDLTKKGLVV